MANVGGPKHLLSFTAPADPGWDQMSRAPNRQIDDFITVPRSRPG